MMQMNGSSKVLTGVIAGVAIGAAAGMLLSPKSGKETRQFIRERTNGFGAKASGLFGKGRHQQEAELSAAADGSTIYGRS